MQKKKKSNTSTRVVELACFKELGYGMSYSHVNRSTGLLQCLVYGVSVRSTTCIRNVYHNFDWPTIKFINSGSRKSSNLSERFGTIAALECPGNS